MINGYNILLPSLKLINVFASKINACSFALIVGVKEENLTFLSVSFTTVILKNELLKNQVYAKSKLEGKTRFVDEAKTSVQEQL